MRLSGFGQICLRTHDPLTRLGLLDNLVNRRIILRMECATETAKANGIEPYAYLKMIFTKLPQVSSIEEIEALLPISGSREENETA